MHARMPLAAALLVGLAWFPGQAARADVKTNALISDGMVLQRDISVPIWGTADEGEKVTVRFQGQEVSTTAQGGNWLVRLNKLTMGGPYEMTVAGKNTLQLKNVLVGEVWVASGQSNMEWSVNSSADPDQVKAAANQPQIRFFQVPNIPAEKPVSEIKGDWKACISETVGGFSAVAYHFARDVQKALQVPVGIIQSDWGGTRAEAWTSRAVLEADPIFKGEFPAYEQQKLNFAKAVEKYKVDVEENKKAIDKAKAEGKTPPAALRPPVEPTRNPNAPSALYNGMIAPLLPYAIRGAIWYQGESNAGKHDQYEKLFSMMIKNWRDDWKQGDFPFLFVQLAPFMKIDKEPSDTAWARLREAQLKVSQKVPNTGMAVITDVGAENDIHPKQKEPVGIRLALAAQALAYGSKSEHSGPVFDNLKVEGNKAILSFKHAGGLVAKGGSLTGFTIAGEDRKFYNAEAEIQGNTIVVSCKDVAKPVAVRFGWANYPVVNLWNKADLPASPFRTDDWPLVTQVDKPKQ